MMHTCPKCGYTEPKAPLSVMPVVVEMRAGSTIFEVVFNDERFPVYPPFVPPVTGNYHVGVSRGVPWIRLTGQDVTPHFARPDVEAFVEPIK